MDQNYLFVFFVWLQSLYEKVTVALEAVALFPTLIVMSQLILFGSLRFYRVTASRFEI